MSNRIPFLQKFYLPLGGLALGILLLSVTGTHVRADATRDPGLLCTFSVQMDSPDSCNTSGAAAQRVAFWQSGLLPRRSLSAQPIDNEKLGALIRDYYAVSRDKRLPLYGSIQDAINDTPYRYLENGIVYISVKEYLYQQNIKLLLTGSDAIVRKDDVSRMSSQYRQFSGVTFPEPPAHAFGWVLYTRGTQPVSAPGSTSNPVATVYNWHQMVDVFDVQTVKNVKWYEVGLGQWVPEGDIRVVTLPASTPKGVPEGAKWIRVDLEQQTVSAYEGRTLVFASQVSSGIPPYYTRPGLFQMSKKLPLQTMSGSFASDRSDYYYVEDVPWVMYFDRARALHGAYWHNNFGFVRSHGCVNLSDADAHWLYDWAPSGTWVYVFDSSGKTPTDDNYYKDDAGSP